MLADFQAETSPATDAGEVWADKAGHGRQRRVLVIEDGTDIQALLRLFLTSVGIDADYIADGAQALDYISDRDSPDLVLLDRMLPGVDGDVLLDRIRSRPQWENTKVIVMSARRDPNEIRQSFDAGANAYITKPFAPIALMRQIRRALA